MSRAAELVALSQELDRVDLKDFYLKNAHARHGVPLDQPAEQPHDQRSELPGAYQYDQEAPTPPPPEVPTQEPTNVTVNVNDTTNSQPAPSTSTPEKLSAAKRFGPAIIALGGLTGAAAGVPAGIVLNRYLAKDNQEVVTHEPRPESLFQYLEDGGYHISKGRQGDANQ